MMSQKEVAEELSLSVPTVRKIEEQAMRKLSHNPKFRKLLDLVTEHEINPDHPLRLKGAVYEDYL